MSATDSVYDRSRVWAVRELSENFSLLAVVEENFRVHADTSKVITRGCITEVLDELHMRLDRLYRGMVNIQP